MIWVDWGIEASSFWQRLGISPFGFSRLSTRGAKSFSQGNYAIGGVWHWFHPFLYRKLLYNQFPSFLTFCWFLWVKNSICHLSASQNICLSGFHKFSKNAVVRGGCKKIVFGVLSTVGGSELFQYSRGGSELFRNFFLRSNTSPSTANTLIGVLALSTQNIARIANAVQVTLWLSVNHLNRCLCSHCSHFSQCLLVSTSVY